ncbi:hypothetical protein LZ32DRAFT_656336 [Colletotrichum eremochloae]|nr:hypothetical protein LZ32DRAFT_656336 [Colletotrichum eremochloae]
MATLVFAQEAGTAVCISPDGILLTCFHYVAETADDFNSSRSHLLPFASDQAVKEEPLPSPPSTTAPPLPPTFPFVTPSATPPSLRARLVCVSHTGSGDLEAVYPDTETGYDVLHLSTGIFRGCTEDRDPQDNSAIGALVHTC